MNLQFFTVDGKTTFARSPLPLRSYRTVPAALVLNRSELEPLDACLTLAGARAGRMGGNFCREDRVTHVDKETGILDHCAGPRNDAGVRPANLNGQRTAEKRCS